MVILRSTRQIFDKSEDLSPFSEPCPYQQLPVGNIVREHQQKWLRIENAKKDVLSGVSSAAILVEQLPLTIVCIDTTDTHAQLRSLIGSIHQYYRPRSMFGDETISASASAFDSSQRQTQMRIVVYGINLDPAFVGELNLWKSVNYIDIVKDVLKSKPESDSVDSTEAWRPFILKHAVERFDKILYIDNKYVLDGNLDDIIEKLNRNGAYFVKQEGQRGSAAIEAEGLPSPAHCDLSIQGYTINSIAYQRYLVPWAKCAMGECSSAALTLPAVATSLANKDRTAQIEGLKCQDRITIRHFDSIRDGGIDGKACNLETRDNLLFLPTQLTVPSERVTGSVQGRNTEPGKYYETHIAIGMPTTSKGSSCPLPDNLTFFKILLPSFLGTISRSDDKRFYYKFYLAFDQGDLFYDNEENQKRFIDRFNWMTQGYPVELHLIRVARTFGWTTYMWNIAFQAAMDDGCDYFYQVNDDLRFDDGSWTEEFISALRNNPVMNGLGVVGPLDTSFEYIIAQAFVSRVHYKIFGYFYPPTFKNWFSDDWASQVYDKARSTFRSKKRVHNTNVTGTRNSACAGEGKRKLAQTMRVSQMYIDEYIKEARLKSLPITQALVAGAKVGNSLQHETPKGRSVRIYLQPFNCRAFQSVQE